MELLPRFLIFRRVYLGPMWSRLWVRAARIQSRGVGRRHFGGIVVLRKVGLLTIVNGIRFARAQPWRRRRVHHFFAFGRFFKLTITPASTIGFHPIPLMYSIRTGSRKLKTGVIW